MGQAADIFVSYTSVDRAWAELLAAVRGARGKPTVEPEYKQAARGPILCGVCGATF
jgi:hypothetical protein